MPMNLIYFGAGAFGLPTLDRLVQDHKVLLIVTQPDRPAGRGGKLTPTPIAQWAAEHAPHIPVLKPEKVNDPQVVAQIRAAGSHAFVVIAFGQKLGRSLLDGVFAINLHASLLPRWRGAAPINAAMLAGDTLTGNSVITLADRMDAGLILGQSSRPITPELTAGELHDLLAADGPALVADVLDRHRFGTTTAAAQDESKVTVAGKLSRADAWVDFSADAARAAHRIHGLTPWPGVIANLLGDPPDGPGTELKLLRVQAQPPGAQQPCVDDPGLLIDTHEGLLLCGGGSILRLLEIQPPGKRPMRWSDYARGHRFGPRMRLASHPAVPAPARPAATGGAPC